MGRYGVTLSILPDTERERKKEGEREREEEREDERKSKHKTIFPPKEMKNIHT